MNDVIIRNMELKDIDDILLIEKLSFKTPWSKEAFINELTINKCANYRVVVKDNRVIAYGGMWIMLDEAHITNIAVHPEFRRCGIGKRLINDMINCCKEKNVHAITLEVRESNLPAINLYKSFNFIEVAIRKKYYTDNDEDAIIMWKYDV
ncbi:ribosomal-protein-alanine N-acetyltransferase [Caloramator sp. E03]|uniref:ribosomal protein S18-alanine N-acetyltransferase n=1 Tax=Caloramator sp. E03 TaxID=2576307 RepID=UPI00111009DE|nr:ribosomal protein S18-alanine N-acetyltransferase [Caloramator sp. E03]QCX33967.1 ribosomal-protein-alanine N-acetyltransferase [Caloramator sp. E03]